MGPVFVHGSYSHILARLPAAIVLLPNLLNLNV